MKTLKHRLTPAIALLLVLGVAGCTEDAEPEDGGGTDTEETEEESEEEEG